MISVRTWIVIGAFALGGAVGGGVVRYAWQAADLAASREQTKQLEAMNAKLKELNDAKDQALSERDSALADLRVRNLDNARLSERLRKSTSAVSDHPIGTCQRHLAECRGLLSEGAQLVAEGGELVGKFDADRTAVRRLTQP